MTPQPPRAIRVEARWDTEGSPYFLLHYVRIGADDNIDESVYLTAAQARELLDDLQEALSRPKP